MWFPALLASFHDSPVTWHKGVAAIYGAWKAFGENGRIALGSMTYEMQVPAVTVAAIPWGWEHLPPTTCAFSLP